MKLLGVCVVFALSLLGQASLSDTYSNVASTACDGSNAGQVAFTTDSIYTARCSGTAWEWYYQGVRVVPPPVNGWTLDAQTGSTVTANADGTVTFYFARRGTVALDLAYRSGNATQTVTALLCADLGNFVSPSTDLGNDTASALGVRDSAGRSEALWATIGNVTGQPPQFYVSVDDWASSTTYTKSYWYDGATSAGTAATWVTQSCHWRRLREDGTEIFHDWNFVGHSGGWVTFWHGSQFSFLGSGSHSPAIMGYQYGNGQRITLLSWNQQ